jgi:hypothetical protein
MKRLAWKNGMPLGRNGSRICLVHHFKLRQFKVIFGGRISKKSARFSVLFTFLI